MPPGVNIVQLCRTRKIQRQEEARNAARDQSDAIERSAYPLSEADAQRPFMIPYQHGSFDVWKLIIDQITDPAEVLKLWDVCPLFREILKYKRKYVQARLPEIIQIIIEKRPGYLHPQENEDAEFEAEEGIVPMHIAETVFNLRKVSRMCKMSTENLLGTEDCKYRPTLTCRGDITGMQSIIDNILGEELAPDVFFFRFLEVDEQSLDDFDIDAFFNVIEIFLELVGTRVITFQYKIRGTLPDIYDKLRNMMIHLPNLKSLELSAVFEGTPLQNHPFEDLQPFPICPHLKSFVQINQCLPEPYLRRIFQACPCIQMVNVDLYDGREIQGLISPFEMHVALPHLEHLDTPMHASLLRNLNLGMPLKQICFYDHETSKRFTTLGVFTFLNQFQETLEHLELWIDVTHSDKAFLNLPRLKVFKWEYDASFKDMRFLAHLGRLEEVETKVYNSTSNAQSFADRFVRRVTKGFDGFTMWQVFPVLKKFEMRFPLLTADGNTTTFKYVRGDSN